MYATNILKKRNTCILEGRMRFFLCYVAFTRLCNFVSQVSEMNLDILEKGISFLL